MSGLRVALVAAEPSGDVLGAGLMQALKVRIPGVQFEGIGGKRMIEQGMRSRVPMERLSVMGLAEVVRHLPELLKLRRDLKIHWRRSPPDLFIGIDAPDFNLGLEQYLRKAGIPTVQFVSPTVWAWRHWRVRKLKRAADLVLSIFPFESAMLREYGIPVSYVGHPLAQQFPIDVDRDTARKILGIDDNRPILALLPGSRMQEIERMSEPFLRTAALCQEKFNDLLVVTPLANEQTRNRYQQMLDSFATGLKVRMVVDDTRTVLSAADVALVTSGTATFEGLLCKCPMVVGYKTSAATYYLLKGLNLVKTPYVAMANILARQPLAPEFLQRECTAEKLAPAVLEWLQNPPACQSLRARYRDIHVSLRKETDRLAASAILELIAD